MRSIEKINADASDTAKAMKTSANIKYDLADSNTQTTEITQKLRKN
ncbi:MAG: hypothetical protein FWF12_11855 [Betaproteobacteria bacterium]|nr:hypothetical protein [Betaproteobacteria bacterium]